MAQIRIMACPISLLQRGGNTIWQSVSCLVCMHLNALAYAECLLIYIPWKKMTDPGCRTMAASPFITQSFKKWKNETLTLC